MDDKDDDAARRGQLRELIELERRCGELRSSLQLTHQLAVPHVTEAAEQAMHALIGLHASDFLSVHASDGVYIWASPSSERLFGWKPQELVGRSAYDLFHFEDLAHIAENHRKHVDGDDAGTVEYRLRCADGEYRWVLTHSTNCKDPNGLPLIVCFTRDVTVQRQQRILLEKLLAHGDTEPEDIGEMIRLCAWCRRIGSSTSVSEWEALETFLKTTTGREVTHGMCDQCAREFTAEAEH